MYLHETLLLIGHGSARYPDAESVLRRHAESLRAGRHFGQVEVAVLNGSPAVSEALAVIDNSVIRVVPILMEDGYFSRVAVPQAIAAGAGPAPEGDGPFHPVGRPSAGRPRRIVLCPPVGVHDGMAGLIERQTLAACAELGLPSHTVAVVIVGHGSRSEPGRALALHRHASRIAATTLFARVEAACLEEAPFVADTLHGLRAHPVVVVGFLANQGGHARDDLPALIASERTVRGGFGPVVHFHGSIIDDPTVVSIVLDQAMSVPGGT